jgi:hypothetical protein
VRRPVRQRRRARGDAACQVSTLKRIVLYIPRRRTCTTTGRPGALSNATSWRFGLVEADKFVIVRTYCYEI